MNGQRVVLGAWLGMIALATLRSVSSPAGGLPQPSSFVGSGVLFTMFYAGAGFAPSLFGVLAAGVVVAAVFRPYLDANGAIPQSGPIFQLSNLVAGISGPASPSTPTA